MSAQVILSLLLVASASLALAIPYEGRASVRTGPSFQQNPSYQQKPSYYQKPSYQQNTAYQQNSAYNQKPAYRPNTAYQQDTTYQQAKSYQVRPVFQPRPAYQPQPYRPQPSYQPRTTYQPRYPDTIPNYNYDYGVRDQFTGASYGANEDRSGDSTRGSYFVDLPDGRRQMVNYRVDGDSGFVAEVTYEGEAIHPAPTAAPNTFRPAYQPTRFVAA